MIASRRRVLQIGGSLLAGLALARPSRATEPLQIRMVGNADGSDVWFDPIGLRVEPGSTVRWTNHDPGNSHTATAYHPRNFERPLRIPPGAEPWHSDYLLPQESFSVTFTVEGVYDYFCVPHEHAGMVGRIVVGRPQGPAPSAAPGQEPLPAAALKALPSVEAIMGAGIVRRS
jgi:plastocyanin